MEVTKISLDLPRAPNSARGLQTQPAMRDIVVVVEEPAFLRESNPKMWSHGLNTTCFGTTGPIETLIKPTFPTRPTWILTCE